ncbi:type II toxin-antitoxin system HicB family antitoxin [bacterium]|nr:type II toxin-antitoxin system HicB family antitoxin [bacterium]
MDIFGYTAVVWKETEGYVSKCPELGVASCGDSFEHAVLKLREAVELYLENAKELNMLDNTLYKFDPQNATPDLP